MRTFTTVDRDGFTLVLALVVGSFASPTFAVPISSQVFANPSVSLSETEAVFDEDGNLTFVTTSASDEAEATMSQGATLDALSAAQSVAVTPGDNSAMVSVQVDASWVDANQGSVTFDNAWESITPPPIGSLTTTFFPTAFFSYTFVADANGILSVAFDTLTAVSPNPFGATGFTLQVDGGLLVRGTGPGVVPSTPSGLVTLDLLAGEAYTLTIREGSNASGSLGANRQLSNQGTFDWSIVFDQPPVEVPEPGTLALLSLGLLAVPFRRRRLS